MSAFENGPGNLQDNTPSAFAIDQLYFTLADPATTADEVYGELYMTALNSYNADLPDRTPAEVQELLGGNFEGFAASRRNPQLVVDHPAFHPDLAFTSPRLVVARHNQDNSVAGYSYAAENVSGGSRLIRGIKQRLTSHSFAALREVVIMPSLPELELKGAPQGTDLAMVRLLMGGFLARQPVSMFTWRENDRETQLAGELGLKPLGQPAPHSSFGDTKGAVMQQAWRGRVDNVINTIDSKPGAYEAIEHLQNNTQNLHR